MMGFLPPSLWYSIPHMSYKKYDSSRAELVYSTAYHKVKNSSLMTTSIDSSKKRVTTKPTKMVEFSMWNRRFVKPISWASDLSKVGIIFNIIEI